MKCAAIAQFGAVECNLDACAKLTIDWKNGLQFRLGGCQRAGSRPTPQDDQDVKQASWSRLGKKNS